jgi:alanyl-tRNA synthetase
VKAAAAAASFVLHKGVLRGAVDVGAAGTCGVDWQRRARIMPNHTMTHVLNHALRAALGDHVDQKGSVVLPEKLSFDFINAGPVPLDKLRAVQAACEESIAAQQPVFSRVVALDDAKRIYGLRAVFGEVRVTCMLPTRYSCVSERRRGPRISRRRSPDTALVTAGALQAYPDPVRVVSVGRSVEDLLADPDNKENYGYSVEFCGGTHLGNTREAAAFAITGEGGIAQGIRRIIAVTAEKAEEAHAAADALSEEVAELEAMPAPPEAAVSALKDRVDRDDTLPVGPRADIRARVRRCRRACSVVRGLRQRARW